MNQISAKTTKTPKNPTNNPKVKKSGQDCGHGWYNPRYSSHSKRFSHHGWYARYGGRGLASCLAGIQCACSKHNVTFLLTFFPEISIIITLACHCRMTNVATWMNQRVDFSWLCFFIVAIYCVLILTFFFCHYLYYDYITFMLI